MAFPRPVHWVKYSHAHSLSWEGKQQDLGKCSGVSLVCLHGRLYLFCSGSSDMGLAILEGKRDC